LIIRRQGNRPSGAKAAAVGFAIDIKPLFRDRDRDAMSFAFDLWSYADVSENADAILSAVRRGSMPCDGAWPSEFVERFASWIAAGKPE
jgi:hypothetical protein